MSNEEIPPWVTAEDSAQTEDPQQQQLYNEDSKEDLVFGLSDEDRLAIFNQGLFPAFNFSDEAINEAASEDEQIFFQSPLNFLKEHRGLRPGSLHLLLAPSSAGKTTLTKSIISAHAHHYPIAVYSTEETRRQFLAGFKHVDFERFGRPLAIRGFQEHELFALHNQQAKQFKTMLCQIFNEMASEGIKILFIDNITTSLFYNDQFDIQGPFLTELMRLARETKIAIFCIAHTSSGYDQGKGLMSTESVRGNKTLTNKAEFMYCMYRFRTTEEHTVEGQPFGEENTFTKERERAFLRIEKHRGIHVSHKLFELIYDPMGQVYFEDKPIDFDAFNEAYNCRQRLGAKNKK